MAQMGWGQVRGTDERKKNNLGNLKDRNSGISRFTVELLQNEGLKLYKK